MQHCQELVELQLAERTPLAIEAFDAKGLVVPFRAGHGQHVTFWGILWDKEKSENLQLHKSVLASELGARGLGSWR